MPHMVRSFVYTTCAAATVTCGAAMQAVSYSVLGLIIHGCPGGPIWSADEEYSRMEVTLSSGTARQSQWSSRPYLPRQTPPALQNPGAWLLGMSAVLCRKPAYNIHAPCGTRLNYRPTARLQSTYLGIDESTADSARVLPGRNSPVPTDLPRGVGSIRPA